jgi:hypothetical protein
MLAGFKTNGPICGPCDGCQLYAAQFCGPGGDNPVAPWELFGDNSAGGFLSADEPCGLILAPPDPADTNFAVLTGVDTFSRGNPGLKQTFEVRTNNVAAGGHAQGSAISAFGFDDPTHYSFGSIVFTYDGTTPSFHSKIKLRIGYRNGGGSVFVTESDWFDFNLGLGTDDGDQGSVAVLCAQPSGDEDGSWSVDFSFLGQQIRGRFPRRSGSTPASAPAPSRSSFKTTGSTSSTSTPAASATHLPRSTTTAMGPPATAAAAMSATRRPSWLPRSKAPGARGRMTLSFGTSPIARRLSGVGAWPVMLRGMRTATVCTG